MKALASDGQRVLAVPADVSQRSQVDRVTSAALDEFGQVHVLVNNAGVYGPLGSIEEIAWDAWVQAIEINLFGSILMCRALLPHFKSRRYGKIVQLSGGGATNPLPRISGYVVAGLVVGPGTFGLLNTQMLDDARLLFDI